MRRSSNIPTAAALACLAAMIAGCGGRSEPPPINYHLAAAADVAQVRRVVFVELPPEDGYAGVAEDTTVALAEAIRSLRLFRLDVVRHDDPICSTLSLDEPRGFTLEQLRTMRETFRCDAILLGRLRNFRPHPCMRLGLDLRLLDLRQGKPLWVVDQTWDTTDKVVEKRIKKYYRRQMRSGLEPMEWQIVTISPQAFEKYVAYETACTLAPPPRVEDDLDD